MNNKFFLEPLKVETSEISGIEKFPEVSLDRIMIFRLKEDSETIERAKYLGRVLSETFPDNHVVLLPHFVDIVKLWPITSDAADIITGNIDDT